MIELVFAEVKAIKVLGTTKMTIQALGGGWPTTIALVCHQLSHQFFMDYTKQKLNILHKGWLFIRVHTANLATLSEIQKTPKGLRPREQNPNS